MPESSLLDKRITDQLLNFAEFCAFTWGRLPSRADLEARFNSKNHPDLSIQELDAYLTSPECLANLFGMGFTENHLVKLYQGRGTDPSAVGLKPLLEDNLTREQLDCLATVSDIADPRPLGRKLKELGISTQSFSNWLYDVTFYKAFVDRLKKTVEGSRLLALNSLALKAANGDNVSIAQLGNLMENMRPTVMLTPKPPPKELPANYAGVELPETPTVKTNRELVDRMGHSPGPVDLSEIPSSARF